MGDGTLVLNLRDFVYRSFFGDSAVTDAFVELPFAQLVGYLNRAEIQQANIENCSAGRDAPLTGTLVVHSSEEDEEDNEISLLSEEGAAEVRQDPSLDPVKCG